MPETNRTAAQAASPEVESPPAAPDGFGEFFRTSFRELVRTAMYAGANRPEAEDAVSKTMIELLPKWRTREPPPLKYLRKAVINNFVKERVRSQRRIARRMVERGHIPHHEGAEDSRLTAWEDNEWVAQVLSCLPPAQREVMDCIARGIHRDDIPVVLGKSKEAVRRNLCDARARLRVELHPKREQPARSTTRFPREEAP